MAIDKLLRTVQADFPFLLDAKFAARSRVNRALKRPHDADFRALALFGDMAPPASGPALYLDVGANRGQSIEDILMFTQGICVWSFEPNPLLCDKLKWRFHNEARVVIKDFGLGDQEGAFKLYVPYYKKWMYDGLASLKREFAADWLRERVYGYQERHLTIKEVDCRIRRLDDVLWGASGDGVSREGVIRDDVNGTPGGALGVNGGCAPFFIKLDVQGYELEALIGGEKTLRRHEPILLIESPDEETCAFLSTLGYEPYKFEDAAGRRGALRRGALGVTNTFFMTEGKASLLPQGSLLGPGTLLG